MSKPLLKRDDGFSNHDWLDFFANHRQKLDEAMRILSFFHDEDEIFKLLEKAGFTPKQREKLIKNMPNMRGVLHLSREAICDLLPLMKKGARYDEAYEQAKLKALSNAQPDVDNVKLPIFDQINNPVVGRALAQCRKVVNACIASYGMPAGIIVELARDVGRSSFDRNEIEKAQRNNQKYREEARRHCTELTGDLDPSGHMILKYRLWNEQKGYCPYSAQYITPNDLKDLTATQIDHILPFARTFDDSYMNKVLCLTRENQLKKNQTPVEYFKAQNRDLERLRACTKNLPNLPKAKIDRLLRPSLTREEEDQFKARNLNDTRYIARMLKNHISRHLPIKDGVQVRTGRLISKLAHGWGLGKKDRDQHTHHARDAIVIAVSTEKMVREFANWNKKYGIKNDLRYRYPPKPWESFRQDALKAIEEVFITRAVNYKITGAAHKETIRSLRNRIGNHMFRAAI
ncbi:MAG: type II CRISPR RNA-guided endonuclease Cas9, partial [Pseudomonadota bacterium]